MCAQTAQADAAAVHDLLRRAVAEKRARVAELERELERQQVAVRLYFREAKLMS